MQWSNRTNAHYARTTAGDTRYRPLLPAVTATRLCADYDSAVAELQRRPDEIEPDRQPNARNVPIGSLQSNVWYHLALAYYLKGEWDAAIDAARRGLEVSTNPASSRTTATTNCC